MKLEWIRKNVPEELESARTLFVEKVKGTYEITWDAMLILSLAAPEVYIKNYQYTCSPFQRAIWLWLWWQLWWQQWQIWWLHLGNCPPQARPHSCFNTKPKSHAEVSAYLSEPLAQHGTCPVKFWQVSCSSFRWHLFLQLITCCLGQPTTISCYFLTSNGYFANPGVISTMWKNILIRKGVNNCPTQPPQPWPHGSSPNAQVLPQKWLATKLHRRYRTAGRDRILGKVHGWPDSHPHWHDSLS